MKYEINIKKNPQEIEEFEKKRMNLGTISIIDPKGKDLSKNYKVKITLTKNGMLGLGTELIRSIDFFEKGSHCHIDAILNGEGAQGLGIYLLPGSPELIVMGDNPKKVDDYFKKD